MILVLHTQLLHFENPLVSEQLIEQLPEKTRRSLSELTSPVRSIQRLAGLTLLQQILQQWRYPVALLDSMGRGPFGKPEFSTPPYFNISHSGNLVLCAASRTHPLGVDTEQIVPISFTGMMHLFTNEERSRIEHGPIEDFYRLWTQKESVVKADGRGVHLPFNQIQIKANQAFLPDDIRPWYLFSLALEQDYSTSLCTRTPIPKITLQEYLPFE